MTFIAKVSIIFFAKTCRLVQDIKKVHTDRNKDTDTQATC